MEMTDSLKQKRIVINIWVVNQAGLTAFTTMINVCVIVAGGICVTKNIINVTDMVTFLLYINVFTEPVKTLVDFTEQFQNGYSGF